MAKTQVTEDTKNDNGGGRHVISLDKKTMGMRIENW